MTDETVLPQNNNHTQSPANADAPAVPPLAPTPPAAETLGFENKLEAARLAMEGPERTVKREEEETEKKVKDEKTKLEKQLAFIGKQKEKLEINWVVLDTKQSDLKKLLAPIKQEEEKIELEEDVLEGEEHTTSDITERQGYEKKRWAVQDRRKELEKRKWELENKILSLEADLKKNTEAYQKLLDEEDILHKQIENLDYEVQAAKERVRLEEERRHQEEQTQQIEAEQKRRQEAEQKETVERERQRAELLARKKAEEEARAKVLAEEQKLKEAEAKKAAAAQAQKNATEQKLRAELEMKRQEAVKKARDIASSAQATTPPIPSTPQPATTGENSNDSETKTPENRTVKIEGNLGTTNSGGANQNADVPPYLPNETTDLPKLRTFKEDVAGQESSLTPDQIKAAKKSFPWLK